MRSESSRAIWLLRFFGLSSTSILRVGVANDAKLYLDERSSVDPKMLCSVFSAINERARIQLNIIHPFHFCSAGDGLGPIQLTIQIIKIIVVLVLIITKLFINRSPANIAYYGAGAPGLARLVL